MNVETFKKNQLLSFEKSLILFKKGYVPDTMFYYFYDVKFCEVYTYTHRDNSKNVCPAFTAHDLLLLLPQGTGVFKRNGKYVTMKNNQMTENINLLDLLFDILN